jgi:hypothetical protein
MGLVTVRPDSPYMQAIAPVLSAKNALGSDTWAGWEGQSNAGNLVHQLACLIDASLGDAGDSSPDNERVLSRAVLAQHAARLLQPIYARCFARLSEAEIDEALQSFALRNCQLNQPLVGVLRKHFNPEVQPDAA